MVVWGLGEFLDPDGISRRWAGQRAISSLLEMWNPKTQRCISQSGPHLGGHPLADLPPCWTLDLSLRLRHRHQPRVV
jgi:hypothetical protein